jgi:hypothetical protein
MPGWVAPTKTAGTVNHIQFPLPPPFISIVLPLTNPITREKRTWKELHAYTFITPAVRSEFTL